MQRCVEMLVPDPDEKSLRLVSKQPPEDKNADLKLLLSDFLINPKRGIHIAVVCGMDNPWSLDDFAEILREKAGRTVISYDKESPPESVVAACICAAVEKKYSVQAKALLRYFFESIEAVLSSIKTCTKPNNGNEDDVKAAHEMISNVERLFKVLAPMISTFMTNEMIPLQIQNNLSSDEVMNGFPTVKLLVFLPETAYEEFEQQDYFFFRQIEYVLHFSALTRKELANRVKELTNRVKELEAQQEKQNQYAQLQEAGKQDTIRLIIGSTLLELQDYSRVYITPELIVYEVLNEKQMMLDPILVQVISHLNKSDSKENGGVEIPDAEKITLLSNGEIDTDTKSVAVRAQEKAVAKERQMFRITNNIHRRQKEVIDEVIDKERNGDKILGMERGGERGF